MKFNSLFHRPVPNKKLCSLAAERPLLFCIMMFTMIFCGFVFLFSIAQGKYFWLPLFNNTKLTYGTSNGCAIGHYDSFNYLVGGKNFSINTDVFGPCKGAIAPSLPLTVYYLPNNPAISWPSSAINPTSPSTESWGMIIGALFLALVGSVMNLYRFRKSYQSYK